jgi:antitoxin component of RelBE/YafQ-DinJ toxin-antitoxin module
MKTALISFRVHPDVKDALAEVLATEHLDESTYVRRLLINDLKAQGALPAAWTGRAKPPRA